MTLVIRFEAGLRPILKHGDHDQKTHGNWATGGGDRERGKSGDPLGCLILSEVQI
jgi:hypothetical protein